MLNSHDYVQMANDRRNAHEDYVAKQANVRPLASPRSVRVSGSLILFLMASLAFLFGSGCIAPDVSAAEAATAEIGEIAPTELVGSFRVYDKGYPSTIEFRADGTFARAVSVTNLTSAPIDQGSWTLKEGELMLVSADVVTNCGAEKTGRYQLSRYEHGGIFFMRLSESCEARVGFVPTAEAHPLQPKGIFCSLGSAEICAKQ